MAPGSTAGPHGCRTANLVLKLIATEVVVAAAAEAEVVAATEAVAEAATEAVVEAVAVMEAAIEAAAVNVAEGAAEAEAAVEAAAVAGAEAVAEAAAEHAALPLFAECDPPWGDPAVRVRGDVAVAVVAVHQSPHAHGRLYHYPVGGPARGSGAARGC
jgi:hypothetical protein